MDTQEFNIWHTQNWNFDILRDGKYENLHIYYR